MGAWASPPIRGCADVVPCGRVRSGPGCGSSHLGRGSWGKGGGGYGVRGIQGPHPTLERLSQINGWPGDISHPSPQIGTWANCVPSDPHSRTPVLETPDE